MRIPLISNQSFYAHPTGNDSNDGLTAMSPVQHPSVLRARLENGYDLCGNTASIHLAPGIYADSINCNGALVGQKCAGNFQIIGDAVGWNVAGTLVQPGPGLGAITLNAGASAQVFGFGVDGTNNGLQDLIEVGPYSLLMIGNGAANPGPSQFHFGICRNPGNHLTLSMGRAGLQVMNSYQIHSYGIKPQCHIDADDAWMYINTNGAKGLITITILDNTNYVDSFVHCRESDLNMQGIGFYQPGGILQGTVTCIVESGLLDTGDQANPNALPGTIAPIIHPGAVYL